MEKLSIEEKAKAYDEAIKRAKELLEIGVKDTLDKRVVLSFFPELAESEDDSIRKEIISIVKSYRESCITEGNHRFDNCISWLEKQGDLKPAMIQWNGENLREVVELTGLYKEGFAKWFHGDWDEYECYVHSHKNIFKLFNEDGSHYEVPVGAWIVKTPDGYNVASKAVFKPSSAGWSEDDEENLNWFEKFFRAESVIAEGKDIPQDRYLWFKNLKGRVQPKQEWSEEDEKFLSDIIKDLVHPWNEYIPDRIEDEIKWLKNKIKSLKPKSQWKPSDEQIKAVKEAACYSSVFSEKTIDNLITLSKQLKKLREEKL